MTKLYFGQAAVRKKKGEYFGQSGYVPSAPPSFKADCPCGKSATLGSPDLDDGLCDDCQGSFGKGDSKTATIEMLYKKSDDVVFSVDFQPMTWDVSCEQCGGEVDWVNIPNKVWTSLGFTKEFICIGCMLKAMNATVSPTVLNLANEVIKQRDRFGLEDSNMFFHTLPSYAIQCCTEFRCQYFIETISQLFLWERKNSENSRLSCVAMLGKNDAYFSSSQIALRICIG